MVKKKNQKFVLGPAEIRVISMLKAKMANEEIVNLLLENRVVTSKSSGEDVKKSLADKKILQLGSKGVALSDAGILLRNALVMIGLIGE